MCLTKSLFISVDSSPTVLKIMSDHMNDPVETVVSFLRKYEEDLIDEIVCNLMYYQKNKGPKFVDTIIHKIADAASVRFLTVNAQQSEKIPFVTNTAVVYECDAVEIVKCFNAQPSFQAKISEVVLESLGDDGKPTYAPFTIDDLIVILHNSLVDQLNSFDYYTECKKFITATVNMVELTKVIENVENSIKLLAAKATYIGTIRAIEETPLYKAARHEKS